MTPGEALRKIKGLVRAGQWFISAHVHDDHPDRRIVAAEVRNAILASFSCEFEKASNRWRVTGPAAVPPARLVCIVAIEEKAVVVTVWRSAK